MHLQLHQLKLHVIFLDFDCVILLIQGAHFAQLLEYFLKFWPC